jgi:hypothetical protein
MSNHVISQVIADMQGIHHPKFGEFRKHVFVKAQEILECLFLIHDRFSCICGCMKLRQTNRMAIDMLDENGR